MAPSRLASELDATKSQILFLVIVMILSSETSNPVKIFMRVFPNVHTWHIRTLAFGLLVHVFLARFRDLLYYVCKVFFHSLLSIFFTQIEVIGLQNVPPNTPVIFCGNHSNQFIDGVMLMCSVPGEKVSFLVAEKSWHRRIIGDFAYAMGCVPVARAQDGAKVGVGTLSIQGTECLGSSTKFVSQVHKGDKIRPKSLGDKVFKVVEVVDNTHLVVENAENLSVSAASKSTFDVLLRVDQTAVYTKVLNKLARGGSIGIFPEGGSHDRTDLLPLKVGVALIAYSTLEKKDINVPIVPVGLNYFHGHRFRGRAVVEFGAPVYIQKETLSKYKAGGDEKKVVCNELMDRIADGMRSVLVTTPNYEVLRMIHTARRLFTHSGSDRSGRDLSAEKKQDISRRFAVCYKLLMEKFKEDGEPQEYTKLKDRMLAYQNELYSLGIRDFQVAQFDEDEHEHTNEEEVSHVHVNRRGVAENFLDDVDIPYKILHMTFTVMIAFLPAVLLNFPVGMVANLYAERKRVKALAGSKVKIHAQDVLLSEKVMLCMVLVPTLWVFYGLVLIFCTNYDRDCIILFQLSLPMFSYLGIMATESGMADFKDLRPHVMKVFPGTRARLLALPRKRRQLARDFKKFVSKNGPSMGALYFNKSVDWMSVEQNMKKKE